MHLGRARTRAAPKVVNHVNRNLESLVIHEVVRAVRDLPPPWERNGRGRRSHTPRIVAICCILRVFLNKTYDEMESWCKTNRHIRAVLGTGWLPTHSVIHRGMDELTMAYVRRVLRHMTFRFRRRGFTVAVDSTGYSLSSSSKWFDIRIRRVSEKRDFLKLHIAIDVSTGLIVSFTITGGSVHDSKEFRRLLNMLPSISRCLGDSAYASRKNCDIVVEKDGEPYLKFKANATGRSRGSIAWKTSFGKYRHDPEAWLAEYHLRSIVESVFGSMKRRWSGCIKSKRGWLRRRELALKVLAYDTKQVLYLQRAQEIGTPLRVPVAQ